VQVLAFVKVKPAFSIGQSISILNTQNDDLFAEVLARKSRGLVPSAATEDGTTTVAEGTGERFSRCLSESITNVFGTMCGLALKADRSLAPSAVIDEPHVSGIIGLSGNFRANVILNLHRDVVFASAESMLGVKTDLIDDDVLDLVRELTNMVAGNAKDRLSMDGVSLGLPTVVAGSGHRVALKSDLAIELLPFRSDAGGLLLEFCLQGTSRQ
jgi:chemotaxis protein CheX